MAVYNGDPRGGHGDLLCLRHHKKKPHPLAALCGWLRGQGPCHSGASTAVCAPVRGCCVTPRVPCLKMAALCSAGRLIGVWRGLDT